MFTKLIIFIFLSIQLVLGLVLCVQRNSRLSVGGPVDEKIHNLFWQQFFLFVVLLHYKITTFLKINLTNSLGEFIVHSWKEVYIFKFMALIKTTLLKHLQTTIDKCSIIWCVKIYHTIIFLCSIKLKILYFNNIILNLPLTNL